MIFFVISLIFIIFFCFCILRSGKIHKKNGKKFSTVAECHLTEDMPSTIEIRKTPKTLKYVENPVFIDVETTGFNSDDRIVSIAIVRPICRNGMEFRFELSNFIFDPLKKSHPRAEEVHGIDDWTLRHQDLFCSKIEYINNILKKSDAIICHNSNFDVSFLKREYLECGVDFPDINIQCTLIEAREQGYYPASLSACAKRIGINVSRIRHNAAEDAFLCAALWFHFFGLVLPITPNLWDVPFENYIQTPDRPSILPRRRNKEKISNFRTKMLEE